MVRIEKTKQYRNAATQTKRAAAFFCCYAKIGRLDDFLRNNYSFCPNSEKQAHSAAVLEQISSFEKGAVPDNVTAPFFCSTKAECFHCKISPSAFAFTGPMIRLSALPFQFRRWSNVLIAASGCDQPPISGPPYLSRAPPLLESGFTEFQEAGGFPFGKTISQESRTL